MTTEAWVLLVVAGILAVLDWVAVGARIHRLELVAKPGATLALAGVAATLDPAFGDTRTLFVVALLASTLGDVFLMLHDDRFVAGLVSFAVAQVLYTVGFALHGGSPLAYLAGAAVMAALVVPLSFRFAGALRRSGTPQFVPPVIVYMCAIGAMAASALASGNPWAVVGALLFVVSDSLIAETRFVGPRAGADVTIMVTYYLAQTGLVLSLLAT